MPTTRRRKAIAALEPAGEGLGPEAALQLVEAGQRHRAVGGDVVPAIGQRRRDIGRTEIVPAEDAGLEQVGRAAAERVGERIAGAAAGEREAEQGIRRDLVVGAADDALDARRGVLRSDQRRCRSSWPSRHRPRPRRSSDWPAARPTAAPWSPSHRRRARSASPGASRHRPRRRPRRRMATRCRPVRKTAGAAGHRRIEQQIEEQIVRLDRGLDHAGAEFARGHRQAGGIERANAAGMLPVRLK